MEFRRTSRCSYLGLGKVDTWNVVPSNYLGQGGAIAECRCANRKENRTKLVRYCFESFGGPRRSVRGSKGAEVALIEGYVSEVSDVVPKGLDKGQAMPYGVFHLPGDGNIIGCSLASGPAPHLVRGCYLLILTGHNRYTYLFIYKKIKNKKKSNIRE